MKIADIMDLLKCFGSAGAEDVESILEKIPVYGGLMSEIVKTAKGQTQMQVWKVLHLKHLTGINNREHRYEK